MASVTFTEIDVLKTNVLPGELSARDDWDTQITAIALGVAAAFDKHCNRTLVRDTAKIDYFTADRDHANLTCYPIESITEIAEKTSYDGSYTAVSNSILFLDEAAGLVHFSGNFGTKSTRLRVTYSGGFWVDTSVAQDGSLPSGAAQLPSDLMGAFYQQVAHELTIRDILGVASATQQANSQLQTLELLPRVKETLAKYIRWEC